MESLPRQFVHMDEIDDKALVAAYKQPVGKLCMDFVKSAIGGIYLPVLHMKTQHMFGAVYIENVCLAEDKFLSVGHDRQGFFRAEICSAAFVRTSVRSAGRMGLIR